MSESHTPVRLLAIDDDAATLRLIQDALAGHRVGNSYGVRSQEGLEAFKSIRPPHRPLLT